MTKAIRARSRENADLGVRECLELMTSGQWVAGKSHITVADKHGVSPTTARDWATNASRIIRIAIEGDVEDIRAQMLVTLGTIVSRCMGGDGFDVDHKNAISAIETGAKLLGLVVAKTEVTMTAEEAEILVLEAVKVAAELQEK